ncbi:cardiolipin synthase [Bacillus horti]|uniref:Cardiolipin synthase n=1 Tax=Caldalkalibacillus horti TaxID=77523 RepID=A0ABT9VZ96_9BACI|nr:cardiolipin synthase [Bacillus horti]MDQ0165930.1 cardiolipin synthase [Bacillus horti]
MSIFNSFYSIISILNILLALTVIFLERRNVGVTWAWIMVLFFLPGIGFVLYLIFGQNLRRRKIYKITEDQKKVVDSLIQTQKETLSQLHYNDPSMNHYQDMIYMNLISGYSLFTQNNTVDIFTDGNAKFTALFQDIQKAKKHIHIVYFIIKDDDLGRRLVQLLAKKAKEGVEVRFLYDHLGSRKLPKRFFKHLLDAGGHVSAFFPSRLPYINFRINYRNHRKMVIIDSRVGYIGGFNVGNEYLGLVKSRGAWRDTHLKLRGSSVLQMQVQFILDWNLASKNTIVHELTYLPVHKEFSGNVGMQIVSSGPDSQYENIKNAYIKMINSAKETVFIQTPYFIPDESLMDALKMAALSGIVVKVMLPSKPDHKFVYWASISYLEELLSVGANCYLYKKGFLHAKTIVVDGKVASVGTANIDIRSFKINFEVNALLYDSETARRLHDIFMNDLDDSENLTFAAYKERPWTSKFKESFARLLSPLL